ncbi:hypothetical protein [Oceanicella actignis]|uniref:hypothetical protein n=1 Tax=Oceanicella actignis TaxID=1189325 RepID=UPI0011E6FEBB|nr:hypothetical protein [Oceanicella actignis]TYO91285.1 hypothetical protein LY05_00136 [Oceanicella actignis]
MTLAANADHDRPGPILRLLMAMPLLGWMLKDAMHGAEDAPLWALANVVLLIVLATAIWGYAALIIAYLGLTAAALAMIIAISRAN